MAPLTLSAAELRRIALAVAKSAAKDDSRPVLTGIHAAQSSPALWPWPRFTREGGTRCLPITATAEAKETRPALTRRRPRLSMRWSMAFQRLAANLVQAARSR